MLLLHCWISWIVIFWPIFVSVLKYVQSVCWFWVVGAYICTVFVRTCFNVSPVCPMYARLNLWHVISCTSLFSRYVFVVCCSLVYCSMVLVGFSSTSVCYINHISYFPDQWVVICEGNPFFGFWISEVGFASVFRPVGWNRKGTMLGPWIELLS